jgi:hypothetical protein
MLRIPTAIGAWLINLFPLSVCGLVGSVALTEDQSSPLRPHKHLPFPHYLFPMDEIPADAFAVFGDAGEGLRRIMEGQRLRYEQLEQRNVALQQLVASLQADASSRETLIAEVGVITKAVVENLPAPVVEVPPAPASTPSARPPKAADPEVFGGDRKKADPFLRAVKLTIAIQPKSFPDDQTKILYALSYMQGGSAGDWASNYSRAILDGDSPFPDWETFCNRFEAAFGDADREANARQRLRSLKMTRGMTAEEYTTAFEAISGKTGFNDEALMDAYEHGLLRNLVEKIHLDTLPLTIQEWKDKATRIDKLWRRFNEQHSLFPANPRQDNRPGTNRLFRPSPNTSQSLPTSSRPAVAPSASSGPMDLDSNRNQNNPRRVAGLCWNCNKPGHIARDCPDPPRSRSVRGALSSEQMEELVERVRATLTPKSTEDGTEGVAKDF